MHLRKKIIITIFALALLALAQLGVVDRAGLEHTEKGLSRALVTYGISRSLNGVISVVQGTEVAIEPVGVGMTFTPGQILDPVNDLIEQFSSVVLISGTAFGIQRVFLDIVATNTFSLLVAFFVVLALATMWFSRSTFTRGKSLMYRTALIFLIIRFSVPAMAVATENFYQLFLAPQYEESSQQLLSTTDELHDLQANSEASTKGAELGGEKSFIESAKDLYRSATNVFDVQQHLDDFKVAAESISEHAIKLIVVFVFQTIILPLTALWLIVKAIRWVAVGRLVLFQRQNEGS